MQECTSVMRELGLSPKHSLGQNFLVDERVIAREVEYADLSQNDVVLEVGPGLGFLTRELAKRAGKVVAVELSRPFYEYLKGQEWDNVELVQGDILKAELPGYNKVVSNIPYQISSPLTFKLLEKGFELAVLIYQREFADRLVAEPGSKDYSRLTVAVDYYADVEVLEVVPRSVFHPRPKVDSAMVRLSPRKPEYHVESIDMYFQLLRDLFSHRRKTIEKCLKLGDYPVPKNANLRKRVGVLSPAEIATLANQIYRL